MKYSASNQITKNALLQSFTGLLTKKPLDEITIGEITDNIGLSRKTFYYHFSDINDLVLWTFNKQIKSALETSDIEQNKQVGLKLFLEELEKRNSIFASIFNSKYSKVLRNGFIDITKSMMSEIMQNVPKVDDFNNDKLYQLFAIAMVSVLEQWLTGNVNLDSDEMFDYINMLIAIVFLGIGEFNEGLRSGKFDLQSLEETLGKLDY